MPLGSPPSAIVTPRVSELVGLPQTSPAEPRNVALMLDAFRQGFITADDIAERIAARKVQTQQVREQLSPEAQEARRVVQQAKIGEAKAALREQEQAETDAPIARALKRAQASRAISEAATMGLSGEMTSRFAAHGQMLPMKKDPETGLSIVDMEAAMPIFNDIQRFDAFKREVETRWKAIKPTKFSEQGVETLGWLNELDLNQTPEQAEAERNRLGQMAVADLDTWRQRGKPSTSALWDLKAGAVQVTPTPSPGQPPTPAPLPVPAVPAAAVTSTAPAVPTVSVIPAVSPRVPVAPSVIPPAVQPRIGEVIPGRGVITTIPVEKPGKAPTEAQQRASIALARFRESGNMMDALEAVNYDPTSTMAWLEGALPEILRSGNRKTYNAAMEAWSQGILRLESGAAISRREESWYRHAFFPQVNDPPTLVAHKARLRMDVEKMVADLAQAGGVATPEIKKNAEAVYERASKLINWNGLTPRKEEGGGLREITLSSGRTLLVDSQGRIWQKKAQPAEQPAVQLR